MHGLLAPSVPLVGPLALRATASRSARSNRFHAGAVLDQYSRNAFGSNNGTETLWSRRVRCVASRSSGVHVNRVFLDRCCRSPRIGERRFVEVYEKTPTKRCSEREAAVWLTDRSNVIGGCLPSLTFTLAANMSTTPPPIPPPVVPPPL